MSKVPQLICFEVMKCRYPPLKNLCLADVCEICVFISVPPHPSKFKPSATKGGLKYSRDDGARRLKMYMQMPSTLEHAQVVNKLTRGRNNSV